MAPGSPHGSCRLPRDSPCPAAPSCSPVELIKCVPDRLQSPLAMHCVYGRHPTMQNPQRVPEPVSLPSVCLGVLVSKRVEEPVQPVREVDSLEPICDFCSRRKQFSVSLFLEDFIRCALDQEHAMPVRLLGHGHYLPKFLQREPLEITELWLIPDVTPLTTLSLIEYPLLSEPLLELDLLGFIGSKIPRPHSILGIDASDHALKPFIIIW